MRLPSLRCVLELFIVGNLGFLGVDIALAHAANGFARHAEWIPIGFSALACLVLIPGLFLPAARAAARPLALAIAAGCVLVGLGGMLYHLQDSFFVRQTLHNLVYSAPFIAPLSYVGVGLLLFVDLLEPAGTDEWTTWVVLLALGGFVGNLGLSLLDHAQNGFFRASEWIPVAAGAWGVSFLALALVRPRDRAFLRVSLGVLAVEVGVGLLGFVLHNLANLGRHEATMLDRLLYGAPAFAPLLFANLALLAAIGLQPALSKAAKPGSG